MGTSGLLDSWAMRIRQDQRVWKNVKHDRVGRAGVSGPDQFKALAVAALRRLQAMPKIVHIFADPNPVYIAKTA